MVVKTCVWEGAEVAISAEAATGGQEVLSSSRQGLSLICPVHKYFSNKLMVFLEHVTIILTLVDKDIIRTLDKQLYSHFTCLPDIMIIK